MITNILKTLLILIVLTGCKKSTEDITKKKRIDPNLDNRITKRAEESGGFLANLKNNKGTTYEFSTSNILWRASLETLDFIPKTSVNYSGGIIVSDWYTSDLNSNDSIKIEIRFLSSEVRASSIKVLTYKKTCSQTNNCKITKGSKNLNEKIHALIMETVKKIKIKDQEKNNNK